MDLTSIYHQMFQIERMLDTCTLDSDRIDLIRQHNLLRLKARQLKARARGYE